MDGPPLVSTIRILSLIPNVHQVLLRNFILSLFPHFYADFCEKQVSGSFKLLVLSFVLMYHWKLCM